VLVGVLVAILDAGIRRAAGLGTAAGLETARRLDGTIRLECAAAGLRGTAGLGGGTRRIEVTTVVTKTSLGRRTDGKRQGGKTAKKQRTTHEKSLHGSDWGGP
jgi:hypothetical protein